MFEARRDNLEKLKKKYLEYLALYKIWNNGSVAGATSFEKFYWRFTYDVKYQDPSRIGHSGI